MVSEGFRADLIRRGVPPAKVHTIRNGVDAARFAVAAGAGRDWRARLGAATGDFLVLYAGTHGISQALPAIADAAALVAARPGGACVRFAFVGDGADKRRLERRVAELGLRNTVLLPGVPHAEMPRLLAAADICLVPLRDVPLFATFIPSKLFECLAAGKPVIGSVTGETAQIIAKGRQRAWCRRRTVPRSPPRSARSPPTRELRAVMGKAGRAFAERRCDRTALARRYAGRSSTSPWRARREAPGHRRERVPWRLRARRGRPPRARLRRASALGHRGTSG